MKVSQSHNPSRSETALFIISSLAICYGVAAIYLLTGQRYDILIGALMCGPAAMAFLFAWLFRGEPPRATGFRFTGWKPWLTALIFPWVVQLTAVALAYSIAWLTGDEGFIVFRPSNLHLHLIGLDFCGLEVLAVAAVRLTAIVLIWLTVSLAYFWNWPARIGAMLSGPSGWGRHAVTGLLWLPVLFFHENLGAKVVDLPGALGEEIGWRGFLVRRWINRPLIAAAITMPVWALFHLPVLFFAGQHGQYLQNIAFLASIAAAAATFQAFYIWSRSVWPCAILHLSWNTWNPLLLGDVYGAQPGLFDGKYWIFNGEGPFGLLIYGAIAIWLIKRWGR